MTSLTNHPFSIDYGLGCLVSLLTNLKISKACMTGQLISQVKHTAQTCWKSTDFLILRFWFNSSTRDDIITLYVLHSAAPKLRGSTKSTRLVLKPGDTLNVSCQLVSGTPTPLVTWSRGHLPVTSRRADATGGRLVVTSLQLDDGGTYSCTASNVAGEDYRDFRLVVEGEYNYQ